MKYVWSGLWFAAICSMAACAIVLGERNSVTVGTNVDDTVRIKRELPASAATMEDVANTAAQPAKKE
jgi:hypothetical protein